MANEKSVNILEFDYLDQNVKLKFWIENVITKNFFF